MCVRAMFLMVWFCCRCVVSCLVSCFDDRRSYRHVVDLKGRRRKDAQLIKVHVNYSLDGCEVRARNGRPGDTKLNEAKHKNAGTEKGKAYKQLKLNFSPGWMATKTTPAAAIKEEPKEAMKYVSGPPRSRWSLGRQTPSPLHQLHPLSVTTWGSAVQRVVTVRHSRGNK